MSTASLPVPPAAPSPALRVATGTAGAGAVLAVLLSGAAAPAAVAVLLAVQGLATVAAVRDRLPAAAVRVGPWCVILLGLAVAVGGGFATTAGLAVLAASTVVGHHLMVSTHRDVAVSLLMTGGAAVLVVSQAPGWTAVPGLALAWSAGAAAVALCRSETATADPAWTGTAVVLGPDAGTGPGATDGTGTGGAPGAWRPVVGRVAWPVVASLVAVLVVGLLEVAPPSAGDGLAGARSGGGVSERLAGGRTLQPFTAGPLDMSTRGDLPDHPVASVPAAGDRLWRVGVLAEYDGRTWYPHLDEPTGPTAHDPLGLGNTDPAAGDRPALVRTDHVRLLTGQPLALLPGHPVEVRPETGAVTTFPSGQVLVGAFATYDVVSRAVPPARAIAGAAGRGPAEADPGSPVWTALPASVTGRTRALAREITRGARSRDEVVAAIEDHLRATYPYELDSPVPPPGHDAVDHFLFEARTGFCVHFAAAEVVLLRSLGVPARVATGFAGEAAGRGEQTRTLRGTDAHAWVEVWQPGTGWAPSDPTPAADAGPLSRLGALLADRDVRRGLAAVLVLLFAGAVVLHARRRRRRHPVAAADAEIAHPLIEAAERLLVALERSGAPSPPDETVAAVARRLPEVSGALEVVERTAYGARPPERAEALQAQAGLDALSGRLLAQASPPRS